MFLNQARLKNTSTWAFIELLITTLGLAARMYFLIRNATTRLSRICKGTCHFLPSAFRDAPPVLGLSGITTVFIPRARSLSTKGPSSVSRTVVSNARNSGRVFRIAISAPDIRAQWFTMTTLFIDALLEYLFHLLSKVRFAKLLARRPVNPGVVPVSANRCAYARSEFPGVWIIKE